MSIYVIRHGQTDWNLNHFYQGHVDIPLNEFGIMQALELRSQLSDISFDIAISSPLLRAYKTAQICLPDLFPIQLETALIERSFGDLEGKSNSEITDCNNKLLLDYSLNYSGHCVEPIQQVFRRVYLFMDNLLHKYHNKNILLATHSAITIAIECYFNGIPSNTPLISLSLENGSYKKYN